MSLNLKNELLHYQKEAVEKMLKLKVGALFMEQGTGKTITTLEIARIRYEKGKINNVIWLCPCTAKKNIKSEILKQIPEEMKGLFTICGIETLSTSVKANAYLRSICSIKTFLVVDESLMIKNHKAYRTKNIMKIGELCGYKMLLNGTPVSRNEADLFAQFYILDYRILGYKSFWSFSANHIEYDDYGKLRKVLNVDYLAQKIAPYSFQVKKSECLDLPEKLYDDFYFELLPEQEDEYDRVAQRLLEEINEWKPETVYRLFSGLQAVTSGKRLKFNKKGNHFETEEMYENPYDNPRVQRLIDIVSEDKTIIFCKYESEITKVMQILEGAVRLDGTVKMKDRNNALEEFKESHNVKYLVTNRNCSGYSLNLQFCNHIIYMSNDWDLGTKLQSEDRVHRIGQTKPVYIKNICAYNTIDERILDCLQRKESLLDSIKNEIKNSENIKDTIKHYIYKGRSRVFDCSELED